MRADTRADAGHPAVAPARRLVRLIGAAALLLAGAGSVLAQQAPGASATAAAGSGQPLAATWTRINAAGSDELWYDRERLVINGAEVTVWRRVVFAVTQQFKTFQVRSALYREQINCDEHTMRVHAQLFHAPDGLVVEHTNFPAPEAVPIVPGTVGDALWRTLCPLVAQRRAVDERVRNAQERLDNRRRELERLRTEVEELEASLARLRAEQRDPARDPVREPARESGRESPREPMRESPRPTGKPQAL